jgi:ferrous iron transport protein B
MAGCKNCGQCNSESIKMKDFKRVVALAGNSNVGKSAIFNQLTGVDDNRQLAREDCRACRGVIAL